MITTAQQRKIQEKILAWYRANGRHDLPWRATDDLYAIVVSEIMLQQTNVPKVIPRYRAFLQQFPSWEKLATAPTSAVLQAWQGLGYNRRALYLQKLAQAVVQKYDGALPTDPEQLMALPGIGPYTSRAVLIFGQNQDIVATDVNIARVVRRWHGLMEWVSAKQQAKEVGRFVPHGKSRAWHSAMMDFASAICTKRNPQCAACPVAKLCKSYPTPKDAIKIRRVEPGRSEYGRHIPRRIFRGRIVEVLRGGKKTTLQLGPLVKKDWHTVDGAWLKEILAGLATEGMIEHKGRFWQLEGNDHAQ